MRDVFDEDFVRSATFIEPSADERARQTKRRRRRRPNWGWLLAAAGVAGFSAFAATAALDGQHTRSDIFTTDAGQIVIEQKLADQRPIPAVSHPGDGFAFQTVEVDGRKTDARFNPCATIGVVWNLDGAPPALERIVREAVEDVRTYTALPFTLEGASIEPASIDRALIQPDLYGQRYAPVLIAWTSAEKQPALAGDVAGVGAGIYRRITTLGATTVERVSGLVLLDSDEIGRALASGREHVAKAIVIHEIGHVIGLEHSDDPTSIMYAETTDLSDLNDSDLAGFAYAGRAAC